MSSRTIEIIAKYNGLRRKFDNADGTTLVIGRVRIAKSSEDVANAAGVDICDGLTIKGIADLDHLEEGQTYRFAGRWKDYNNPRFGIRERQFEFRTYCEHIQADADGLTDYIKANSKSTGIGPAKARRLVESIGIEDVLHVVRTQPARVAEITGVSLANAEELAARLRAKQKTEHTRLEVNNLLAGRGFSRTLPDRVIKEWGNEAATKIADDPFSLMHFHGVGFGLADGLWNKLGKDPLDVRRQTMCAWNAMARDTDSHTWFAASEINRRMIMALGGGVRFRDAILHGKSLAEISVTHHGSMATIRTSESGMIQEGGQNVWIAEAKNAADEVLLADRVVEMLARPSDLAITQYQDHEIIESQVMRHATCQRCARQLTAPTVHVLDGQPFGPTCIGYVDPAGRHETLGLQDWLERNPRVCRWIEQLPSGVIRLPGCLLWPEPSSIEGISDHQREAIAAATSGPFGMLLGSPGTGKTYTTAALIKAIWHSGRVSLHEIGVMAPTGKAAVRLNQSLQESGIPLQARTIHSWLGFGSDGGFAFGENAKWPLKVVIIDESSMPTVNIMAAVWRALPPGAHVLLVGDQNQLPPVGNGAPLRDMIDAGLPRGELEAIKRNDGGIVQACALIRQQQPWAHLYSDGGQNLQITGDSTEQQQIDTILRLLEKESERGIDPIWDCQVLVAINRKSGLSRVELNKLLQGVLNPASKTASSPFRLGDKVVCLKNGFYRPSPDSRHTESRDGELYVANGELGRVEDIEPKKYSISLDGGRVVEVYRGQRDPDTDGGDDDSASTGCNWDLGYALSVHKFQGSEQKVIIGALDTHGGARMVCDRAWLYTMISRARERAYLVGTADTADRFCRHNKMHHRKTFLKELIKLRQYEQDAIGI